MSWSKKIIEEHPLYPMLPDWFVDLLRNENEEKIAQTIQRKCQEISREESLEVSDEEIQAWANVLEDMYLKIYENLSKTEKT